MNELDEILESIGEERRKGVRAEAISMIARETADMKLTALLKVLQKVREERTNEKYYAF